MPIPLSFTLLTLLLPFASSQSLLQFVDNLVSTNLTLTLNTSVTHRLELPSTTAILRLEWTSLNQTAFPTTLFYLSNTTTSPIKTTGTSLDHNPSAANHSCKVTHPCATIPTIDFEPFYTRSSRSFLRYPFNDTVPNTVYVTVFNYQSPPAAPSTPSSPQMLRGVLSARILTDESEDCPGGINPGDPVCSSHGKCVKSRCECENSFIGRACETPVIPLPRVNKPPEEKFLVLPAPDSFTARIDVYTGVVFSATQRTPGMALRFEVLLLRGKIAGIDNNASRDAPAVWLFTTPPPLGEPLLKENVTVPTLGGPPIGINRTEGTYCARDLEDRETVYLGFYALPTKDDMTDAYAIVNINQTETRPDQCTPRASSIPLGLALVPAFLVTTAVAATGVLVMVWLDCRHGFTNRVDRLSSEEIERMYPPTPYRGETVECAICLSEIEPSQQVRTLKCTHVYHTECLDPWLTQNRASCPTCRTDVRVEQLSDKRHVRRIVQFFLAPLVHIRHLRERRRATALDGDTSPDLETGDAGATLNPESNHQHESTNINALETANDTNTTTIQPTEPTPSQPPATDTPR